VVPEGALADAVKVKVNVVLVSAVAARPDGAFSFSVAIVDVVVLVVDGR
jgi:hypothetical protein